MHEKLIRFKIIKDDRVVETYLDERLSFDENIKLLANITDFDTDGFKVYDPDKKVFLDNKIPIEVFNINSFILMYLF